MQAPNDILTASLDLSLSFSRPLARSNTDSPTHPTHYIARSMNSLHMLRNGSMAPLVPLPYHPYSCPTMITRNMPRLVRKHQNMSACLGQVNTHHACPGHLNSSWFQIIPYSLRLSSCCFSCCVEYYSFVSP